MSLPRIIVVGAGGHAAVVVELLQAAGAYAVAGVLDPAPAAPHVLGVPVLGGDERLPGLLAGGIGAAVVALGGNRLRQSIGASLLAQGYALPAVVHPGASVSPSASIGPGAVVMNRAVVGTRTRVGAFAIINTGAVVDHDNDIGAGAHIAPGSALAGNVQVGEGAMVGIGSAVRPGIRIGAGAVVGAGSAVVADVPDGATVGGTPARALARAGVKAGPK